MQGAEALGQQYARGMAAQAADAVRMVTQENQNDVYLAAAAMPDDFEALSVPERAALMDTLTASLGGRRGAFFYYSQGGVAYAGDGTALGGSGERGGYAVYFTVPVRNEAGTIVAAFSLRRDAYLYSDALAGLSLCEHGYTCLVNDGGTVIAASNGPYRALIAQETDLTALQSDYGEASAAAIAGGSGLLTSVDETVGDAVVAYTALQPAEPAAEAAGGISLSGIGAGGEAQAGDGWAVLVYLPKSELQGYLEKQAGNSLWGGVGVGLAAVLYLWRSSRLHGARRDTVIRERVQQLLTKAENAQAALAQGKLRRASRRRIDDPYYVKALLATCTASLKKALDALDDTGALARR